MAYCDYCAERAREATRLHAATAPICLNTDPAIKTIRVCTRMAGHKGEHSHCRGFDGHKNYAWERKPGDWSGSNLDRTPTQTPKEK